MQVYDSMSSAPTRDEESPRPLRDPHKPRPFGSSTNGFYGNDKGKCFQAESVKADKDSDSEDDGGGGATAVKVLLAEREVGMPPTRFDFSKST